MSEHNELPFGTLVPKNWNVPTLEEMSNKSKRELDDGDWVESDDMDEEGEFALIQLGNIGRNKFKGEPKNYVAREFIDEENCMVLHSGDLLISRMAEPIFRACRVPERFDKNSITAVDIMRLTPDEEHTNSEFLNNVLNWQPITKQASAWSGGTTRERISKTNSMKIAVPLPPITEQERIASVLYSVDEHVRTLNNRHDTLTNHKQALMQELLSDERRVSDDVSVLESVEKAPSDVGDSEWKNEELPELFEKYQAGGTPTTSNEDYYSVEGHKTPNDYHFLKIASITDNKYISSGDGLLTQQGLDCSTARLFDEGDLVLSIYGSYGKVGILKTEAAVSQAMLGIVPNKQKINPEFLYYLLDSLNAQYEALASGTTQQNLSKSLIGLIDVDIPPLWEQERIASILYTVDEMIARTASLRDEYERLKQGLMQDLLSGDVRTPEQLDVLESVTG
jgi:type I restriction enzyme S subunit